MQQPPSQQQNTSSGGAASELKSDAKQIGSKAADRLHSEVDARKETAVTQAQSVSSAVRQAADGLDEGAPQWLRSAFQQGADQLQRFADSIEQKDSRQLLNDVQSFARERPALFLGAAAAAGFAAARILKAGGEQQSSQQYGATSEWDRSEPWGSGEQNFDRDFSSTGTQSGTLGDVARDDNPMFQDSTDRELLVARPETDSPTSSRMQDDPLILTPDDATGTRATRQGEFS